MEWVVPRWKFTFTFQYVSINTVMNGITYERLENFTFQYVSINTVIFRRSVRPCGAFTFQYVSINTKRLLGPSMDWGESLHSNMFLLIQKTNFSEKRDHFPLHSNMFLLILLEKVKSGWTLTTLHSNMFLLILVQALEYR